MPQFERFNWQYFVARSGRTGRLWTEEFARHEYGDLAAQADAALALSRRRQLQPAFDILDAMQARISALKGVRASIAAVLERLYHGVLAYCYYGIGDFDAAQNELVEADRCVRLAVDADRVLLPFAHDCHEFQLHHARIARNQRRWNAMHSHVEVARGIVEDRLPLCELSDGTIVDYAALVRHYETLSLAPEERQELLPIMDVELRRHHFNRFLMQLYLLPGLVIPYR